MGNRLPSCSAAIPIAFCIDDLSRLTNVRFGLLRSPSKADAAATTQRLAGARTLPQTATRSEIYDQAAFWMMPESLSEDRL